MSWWLPDLILDGSSRLYTESYSDDSNDSDDDDTFMRILVFRNSVLSKSLKRYFYIKEILPRYYLQDLLVEFVILFKDIYGVYASYRMEYFDTKDWESVNDECSYWALEKTS